MRGVALASQNKAQEWGVHNMLNSAALGDARALIAPQVHRRCTFPATTVRPVAIGTRQRRLD
jgi:hypothetical protein